MENSAQDEKILVKQCRYCQSDMDTKAYICPVCNNNQNRFVKNLFNITTLLSIAVVVISYLQFNESRIEREAASIALMKADSSLKAANLALVQALKTKEEVEKSTLTLLEIAIRDYDMIAYRKLFSLKNDPSFLYREEAKEIISKYFTYYTRENPEVIYNSYVQLEFDPKLLLTDKFYQQFSSLSSFDKLSFITLAISDTQLNNSINFLIKVIKTDDNIKVVGYASQTIINKFKLKFHPLEIDKILLWWQNNKENK